MAHLAGQGAPAPPSITPPKPYIKHHIPIPVTIKLQPLSPNSVIQIARAVVFEQQRSNSHSHLSTAQYSHTANIASGRQRKNTHAQAVSLRVKRKRIVEELPRHKGSGDDSSHDKFDDEEWKCRKGRNIPATIATKVRLMHSVHSFTL